LEKILPIIATTVNLWVQQPSKVVCYTKNAELFLKPEKNLAVSSSELVCL